MGGEKIATVRFTAEEKNLRGKKRQYAKGRWFGPALKKEQSVCGSPEQNLIMVSLQLIKMVGM